MTSTTLTAASDYQDSPQFHKGKFRNTHKITRLDIRDTHKLIKDYLFEKHKDANPSTAIPLRTLTKEALLADSSSQTLVYKLGHSTLLLNIQGEFWLTDPVFSERASPLPFAGPKRFHPTPISIAELPEITGVIISHNHYDHLDKNAIRQLSKKVNYFLTPLGVGKTMAAWGVDKSKITEMDWWESKNINGTEFVATPSQHFSGRGAFDSDETLWCSWAIQTPQDKIFFSGDSGYFDGFKEIGEKYGPFDLTLIETGAYNKLWPHVHMQPSESMQAHLDLNGKHMIPIHNGTFDLALHSWYDPLDQITELGKQHQASVLTPIVGERIDLANISATDKWWLSLK